MSGFLVPAVSLGLMALGTGATIWYLKQIRTGRADPVADPAWPNVMQPAPQNLAEPDRDAATTQYRDGEDPTN